LTETLTESFCERCGTRYEFAAPTRLNPLRKTRGLFGGLRNYLTSQDALSDAIGDAMRSEEEGLASAQLDAFHESFNFCIDCRQYTCVNCWNDDAGRCRSCAPVPGTDDLAERLAASLAAPPLPAGGELSRGLGLEVWPTSDLPSDELVATNGHPVEAWPAAEGFPAQLEQEGEPGPDWIAAEVEPEPAVAEADLQFEPEPAVAEADVPFEPEPAAAHFGIEPEREPITAEIEPEPEPVAAQWELEPEPFTQAFEPTSWPIEAQLAPEPVVAEVEPEPAPRPVLRVVAWDEDSSYEILEPEPFAAAAEFETEPFVAEVEPELEPFVAAAEPEPEPVVAEVEPEPEPVVAEVEPEPEPFVAAAEPEPEPVVAEVKPEPEPRPTPIAPRIAPIRETILHFPPRPAPPDRPVEQEPAAAIDDTPELAARRAQLDLLGLGDPGQGPVAAGPQPLPYRSRGAGAGQEELARQAVLRGSFWEASAREVAAGHVGVQSCGECGLSLSANARFCRRCGTRQAQSA
jgi:hypothetical protein